MTQSVHSSAHDQTQSVVSPSDLQWLPLHCPTVPCTEGSGPQILPSAISEEKKKTGFVIVIVRNTCIFVIVDTSVFYFS